MRIDALVLLAVTITFVASPLLVTSFAGFDPDLYPIPQADPPVQPAGYAFAIWSVIYGWLILHAGFGLLRRADDPDWSAVRGPLSVSLAIGTFWLAAAERSPVLATVMIFAMLIFALMALGQAFRQPDRWLLLAPVALYAGWLSAASCASLGLLGGGYGVQFGEVGWAYTAIAVAAALAVTVQLTLGRAPEYGLAVAWALVAIAVKNFGVETGVALAAGIAAIVMLSAAWQVARVDDARIDV